MDETRKAPAGAGAGLHATLLAFARAPGQWRVQGRQPALLYASIPEILAIAASMREVDAPVRAAALFFVRAGLLHPDADAHAVFGYPEGAEPVGLKERYRLLARLTHPDRAAAVGVQWPEGTAARINGAYAVLAAFAQPAALPAVAEPAPRRRAAHRAPRRPARRTAFALGLRGACAFALAVAVVAGVLLETPEGGQLVQVPARTVRLAAATLGDAVDASDAGPVHLHLSRWLGHEDR